MIIPQKRMLGYREGWDTLLGHDLPSCLVFKPELVTRSRSVEKLVIPLRVYPNDSAQLHKGLSALIQIACGKPEKEWTTVPVK